MYKGKAVGGTSLTALAGTTVEEEVNGRSLEESPVLLRKLLPDRRLVKAEAAVAWHAVLTVIEQHGVA